MVLPPPYMLPPIMIFAPVPARRDPVDIFPVSPMTPAPAADRYFSSSSYINIDEIVIKNVNLH